MNWSAQKTKPGSHGVLDTGRDKGVFPKSFVYEELAKRNCIVCGMTIMLEKRKRKERKGKIKLEIKG